MSLLQKIKGQKDESTTPAKWPVPLQVVGRSLRDWWDDWVNMVVLNLILALAWLTIVLGPPATFGLYYVTDHLARGKSLGPRGLIEGGRRYFLQSWLWFLLNLAVALIIGVNYFFYASFTSTWADYLKAAFLLLGLAWLVVQFYALPYFMAQQEKRVGLALRNGLFTALAAPGYSLVVAGAAGLVFGLSISTVVLLFLGGPCLVATLGSHVVFERMKTYRIQEREELQIR
jgi:uncharacterized membrane protein YesL